MESTQDLAVNTLLVLDDTYASENRSACAIFNGGIDVAKNIRACDIDASLVSTLKAKVADCMSVQRNLYVEGSILPFSSYSTASLGSRDMKWNNINTICIESSQGIINTLATESLQAKNIKLISCTTNISDTVAGTPTYNLTLNYGINIFNLTSTYEGRNIILSLPLPEIGSNHDIKRVIFKQDKLNTIKWIYNATDYLVSDRLEQVFDLINLDGTWRLVNYIDTDKNTIIQNSTDIGTIKANQEDISSSLVQLASQVETLVNFNSFLSVTDPSANTIFSFLGDQNEIKDDVTGIRTSIDTIANTLSCVNSMAITTKNSLEALKTYTNDKLGDISANLVVTNSSIDMFKSVSNETFLNIDRKFISMDTSISNLNLATSELKLEVRKNRELLDLIDKKLCDHMVNSDAKMKYLDDKMKHMDEKMDIVLRKCGITFC